MEFIMYLNREHRFVGEIQGELFESVNLHLYRGETEDSIRTKLLKFISKFAKDGEIKPSTFELFSIWNKSWEGEWVRIWKNWLNQVLLMVNLTLLMFHR